MARPSRDSLGKLKAFIESLPEEARSKCALCNEALTHIVKQAEAQTGAGTATVTKMLAKEINANAAPGDRVTPDALRARVRDKEGTKRGSIRPNGPDKPVEPLTWTCSDCKGTFPLDQEACDCGKGDAPFQSDQPAIWEQISFRLTNLAQYVMENCETPANISEKTKKSIFHSLNIINLFFDNDR